MIVHSLKAIPDEGLYLVAQDAQNRIGSHFIGGNSDDKYLQKQESIIAAVQEEINFRKKKEK